MIFKFSKHIFLNKKSFYFLICILGPIFIFFSGAIYLRQYEKELTEQNKRTFEQFARLFEDRLKSYVFGLQGMGGIYRVKDFYPTANEVRDYSVSRDNFKNFQGALGFGFIRAVDNRSVASYAKNQKVLDPRFNYKELSQVNDELSFVIENVEPFENNVRAIGLNISSEKERRLAAWEAVKTGQAVISREIQLVQTSIKENGYLIFLPLYQAVKVPATEVERVQSIVGFAYTPILSSSILNYLNSEMHFDFKFAINMLESSNYFFNNLDGESAQFNKVFKLLGRDWELSALFPSSKTFHIISIITYIFALIGSLLYIRLIYFIRQLLLEKKSIGEKYGDIENRLNTVVNNTSLSIIATDKNGIIDTINMTGLKMLGYEEHELVGKANPLLFHDIKEVRKRGDIIKKELNIDREINEFEVFILKTLDGVPDINNWTYVRKDGSRFPVRLIVTTLFNYQKEIVGYLGVAEDISERIKLQNVIEEQRAQMYESSKLSTLGEMASGIAHEINNPLTIIRSKVNQIAKKMELGQLDPMTLKKDLEKIDETVFRISKIILGLRLLSRDSSQDDFRTENLLVIIDEVLSLCTERFRNHNIKLMYELQGDVMISARASQIGQVILNLLNNSFDAVESMSDKWVKISLELEASFVVIKVTDSGHGIPTSIISKIFEPFYTTKEVGKGTGLGLSISKNIIMSHGGEFSYDHKAMNTTFIIKLPRL